MNQHLYKLTLLIVVSSALVCGRTQAQSNSDWIRRQQQQQQIQRQQQEQQRQQMQQQQRQQMQQQQRQQMQQQMRQQQRQQIQQQMRQQQTGVGRVPAYGTPRTLSDRPGFTGKTTRDGRPLASINGRVLAVPNMRAALSGRGYGNGQAQTARWSDSKRATISAELQKLATSNLKERVRTGGPGGLISEMFIRPKVSISMLQTLTSSVYVLLCSFE